eukprot:4510158-Amphidinium_carterae.1
MTGDHKDAPLVQPPLPQERITNLYKHATGSAGGGTRSLWGNNLSPPTRNSSITTSARTSNPLQRHKPGQTCRSRVKLKRTGRGRVHF